MALSDSIRFVKNATRNSEFRKSCAEFDSKSDLLAFYKFDELEFDDAINMQLVKCQTYEEAEIFQQLRMWFQIL